MNRTSNIGIRRPLPALGIVAATLLLPACFISAPLQEVQAAGSPYCNERGNGCNDRDSNVQVERSTPTGSETPAEPDPPAEPPGPTEPTDPATPG